MSVQWHGAVNQTAGAASISSIDLFVEKMTVCGAAPIDTFYNTSQDIFKIATPDLLNKFPSVGPLLLVGLVSATENYFRDIFASILRLCPIAKACSAEKNINIGTVLWHAGLNIERGAFEHISLAGSDVIRKTCEQFLGYKIKENSSSYAMLKEFDKVCELRHSIVHSGLIIAGQNAVKLRISTGACILRIKVSFGQLQECGLICTTLVSSFNSELFQEVARRWAIDWPKQQSGWTTSKSNALFKSIWDSFYSTVDQKNAAISVPLTIAECKKMIRKTFL